MAGKLMGCRYVGTCVELLNPLLKVTQEEQRFYIDEMKTVAKTLPQSMCFDVNLSNVGNIFFKGWKYFFKCEFVTKKFYPPTLM